MTVKNPNDFNKDKKKYLLEISNSVRSDLCVVYLGVRDPELVSDSLWHKETVYID